jgi:gliding motility-associated-like protein
VEVFVPTAFTPNSDGLNDILRPVLMGIKEIRRFSIFNRWGQLIFETKTDRDGWDGTLQGSPVSSQAVVWMFEGIGVDNKMYMRKGTSILDTVKMLLNSASSLFLRYIYCNYPGFDSNLPQHTHRRR